MKKSISKKQLRIERQKQVAESWNETYLNKGKMVERVRATELALEDDGFYKYAVQVFLQDGYLLNFEYFAKANFNNQIM